MQATFEAMNEGELVVQQIALQGAVGAIAFLLEHQCHPLLAAQLFAHLRAQLALAQQVAGAKGFDPVVCPAPNTAALH